MPALLLPNRILSLSAETADKLLTAGGGDAALFYLGLLRHNDVQTARKALEWTDARAAAAFEVLVKLGLAEGSVQSVAAPEESDTPPVYQRSDILTALQNDSSFHALHEAVSSALGRTLSDQDRSILYTIYDYLALPTEVIYQLVGWCITLFERKYGPGKRPRLPAIQKEAFRWKRMGVDTLSAAEEFLAKEQLLLNRENQILPLLDIRGRAPVDRERQYIAGWVDMGFEDEAIRLAYERTVMQKGSLNWAYINSILKRWHEAGLHTVAQIEAGDKPAPRDTTPKKNPTHHQTGFQPSAERIRKNADWLDQYFAERGKQEG